MRRGKRFSGDSANSSVAQILPGTAAALLLISRASVSRTTSCYQLQCGNQNLSDWQHSPALCLLPRQIATRFTMG
uniref:Uncharacterized protein n=1 Tax=Arundo donax TaxID=35708 RepID=A0A0A9H1X5_ARUDO